MAKRPRSTLWGKVLQRTFQRTVAKLARTAIRAGTKALVKAARPAKKAVARRVASLPKAVSPARPAASPRPLKKPSPPARLKRPLSPGQSQPVNDDWTLGVAALGAATRRYRIYRPAGSQLPLPLLVMLHGCGQDADSLASSTRMNRIAAREGFLVLYPEQDRLAHGQGCWNWYETRTGRAQAEAALIVAAIDQAVTLHGADPTRVAIAGLSAGGAMAALVALRHPERICAVAMHSGVAPGAAQSTATALSAMQGRRKPVIATVADGMPALPPMLVIQGSNDSVVRAANGREAATAWATAMGAKATAPRTLQRGKRQPVTVTDFVRAGHVRVSLCEIAGLGHAWSGGAAGRPYSDPAGPDASKMIWAFASRQFRQGQSAVEI